MHGQLRILVVAAGLAAGACSGPEVAFQPPIYCYQSLAAVTCLDQPHQRDEQRLVNYIGPHPNLYPEPLSPPSLPLHAPAPVDYWVKDTEPVPQPAR